MAKKLHLYVWEDVLIDWSFGIMFALAHTPEEARALLKEKCPHLIAEDLALPPLLVESPAAFYVWGGG